MLMQPIVFTKLIMNFKQIESRILLFFEGLTFYRMAYASKRFGGITNWMRIAVPDCQFI